jgi:hypothetical protein
VKALHLSLSTIGSGNGVTTLMVVPSTRAEHKVPRTQLDHKVSFIERGLFAQRTALKGIDASERLMTFVKMRPLITIPPEVSDDQSATSSYQECIKFI